MCKKIHAQKSSNFSNYSKTRQVSTRTGIQRMFKIIGFLQNGHIDGKPVNATTLGREFEVDRSTVMRDLSFLRDRFGVEFEWVAEENGYVLTGDVKSLPSMELNDLDKLVLEYIAQSLAALVDTELGREMQKSFERLATIFTGKSSKNNWGVHAVFECGDRLKSVSELKIFHLAQRALRSGLLLKVAWKKDSLSEAILLEVKPMRVEFSGGRWVLDAVSVSDNSPMRLFFETVIQIELLGMKSLDKTSVCSEVKRPQLTGGSMNENSSGIPLKAA